MRPVTMEDPTEEARPDRVQIIWTVVSQIPRGATASYGEVARRAGLAGMARYVGFALGRLPPDATVPWYRVVNSQRRISFPPGSPQAEEQKGRLQEEGVVLEHYRVNRAYFQG